ncbi:MAG TPA: hypothetical protein VGK67_34100 [Myxococcales bacterium]|jgi:hypothetical protein
MAEPNPELGREPERREAFKAAAVWLLVPLLYVLSFGPVAAAMKRAYQADLIGRRFVDVLEVAYFPLVKAADKNKTVRKVVVRYLELWEAPFPSTARRP